MSLKFFYSEYQGGGWCSNMSTCLSRKDTRLGSSKKMEKLLPFIGILSSQRKFNPGLHVYLTDSVW